MYKGLIIYLTMFIGLALIAGGSYFIIDNFEHPKGLLFEGIMSLSIGVVLWMLIVVANSVGKALIMFGEILEQTAKLNKLTARPSLQDMFSGMTQTGSSVNITNLDTGEMSSSKIKPGNAGDMMSQINNLLGEAMNQRHDGGVPGPVNKDSSREELEIKLAEAIKNDDFEMAAKINELLKPLKDSDDNQEDSENKSE